MTRRVVLYTKEGCHLCHETREHLDALAAVADITVGEIDITTDADLLERYRDRIPVVDVGSGYLLFAPISLDQLREALL